MKQYCVKEYLVPENLAQALDMLTGEKVVPLAGATDLFCVENLDIDAFVDITDIGLSYVKEEKGKIKIGAGTTFSQIIKSKVIEEKFVALHDSCRVLADYSVRNVGTIGGNICTGLSSGDVIPPLIAVGAEFVLQSKKGARTVKADDFFTGNRQTLLKKDELLIEIIVDPYSKAEGRGTAFEKIARSSVDIAVASAAVGLTVKEGKITQAIVALGAVGPTVVRARKVEAALVGQAITEELAVKITRGVAEEIAPITNVRSTKEYRSDVTCELAARAVMRAYKQGN